MSMGPTEYDKGYMAGWEVGQSYTTVAKRKLDAIRELCEHPVEVELGAEMVPVVDLLAILDPAHSPNL